MTDTTAAVATNVVAVAATSATITHGIAGFFRPNPLAHAGDAYVLGPERAGYYTTAPLERTLEELVDFDLVNRCRSRLTVGAAHVRTSQMRYFDNRDGAISVKHVMASGALPSQHRALAPTASRRWRRLSLSTASRRYSTPTRARSSPAPRSPAC